MRFVLIGVVCCDNFFWVKNTGTSLHGGATATLVDMVGSAVIYTVGSPVTGVSVEINVSYLDGAYVGVCNSFLLPEIYLFFRRRFGVVMVFAL